MTDLLAVKASAAMPAGATATGTFVFSNRLTKSTGIKKAVAERAGFSGATGTVWVRTAGEQAEVLIGLGHSAEADQGELVAGVAAFMRAVHRHRKVGIDLGDLDLSEFADGDSQIDAGPSIEIRAAGLIAKSAILANYFFDEYRTTGDDTPKPNALTLVTQEPLKDVRAEINQEATVAAAVCFARDLVNTPGGDLTPAKYADLAAERAQEAGLVATIYGEKDIVEMELGGLIAVNKGSEHPARLLKLVYEPVGAGENTPTVALVGKGITFDSGGLSLKPSEAMMGMKMDMGGSAAVIGAMCALPTVNAPVRVVGFTPMTDNMTGGDAQRPGDVYTAKGGTTVEVLNTDAEGRLVLADALTLASAEDPDAIIDLATLTGACVVALGEKIAGLMGNNDEFRAQVADASAAAGERMWALPLPEDYAEQLKSDIADIKNIGTRYGGSLTAGLFLKRFVADEIPWVHIDIAGPAYASDVSGIQPKGGTGFGVLTLVELLGNWPFEPEAEAPDELSDASQEE